MSEKRKDVDDRIIAAMLNDVSACGMKITGVEDVFADYFTVPSGGGSDVDSDSDVENNDSDDDDDKQSSDEDAAGPSSLPSSDEDDQEESEEEEPMSLELDDEAEPEVIDDAEDEAEAAANLARELVDLEPLADKVNKCKCALHNGRRCIEQFTRAESDEIRYTVKELTEFEKDLLLLGIISSSVNDATTVCGKKRKKVDRKQTRMRSFYYGQKRVCRYTFFFLMNIGPQKFTNLKNWYNTHGLVPRRKKSGGRRGKKLLKLEHVQGVVKFIVNLAAQHCILLPGRIPGVKSPDVKLLPTSFTKAEVWRLYRRSLPELRPVALSTFRKLWKGLLPYIVVAKPSTDLCWTCQKNNSLIIKQVNVPEGEKTEALQRQQQHLLRAQEERDFYNSLCRAAKATAVLSGINSLGENVANSKPMTFHYSFDFAQQVHYPADPHQPGPIFFKTPRKCHIFGVVAEGLPAQVNYLADEGVSCGKGANVVVSYLHHFLGNYGLGEQHVHLHADNCSGQNKNNAMLQYLAWRVSSRLHKSVKLSFLPVGHTKFAPDWCFGLLKRKYRRTYVSSLQEICDVVDASSVQGINIPQLVGNESGEVFVPVYDWVNHLSPHYKRFPGVKSYQHFSVSEDNPGSISFQEHSGSDEQTFDFARSAPSPTLPPVVPPPGIDAARKQYLFHQIREFCKEETRDLVCPEPEV